MEEKETSTKPNTPGTTGKPKGVRVPHRSRAWTLNGRAEANGGHPTDDRSRSIAPRCQGAGMNCASAPKPGGGHAEMRDDLNPELVMKTNEEENITGFFGVPTHFYGMLGIDQSILDSCTGSSLKTIISKRTRSATIG
jgi:Acyl-CoA synthetases (AMP-forming)/AMP-acid ligases II